MASAALKSVRNFFVESTALALYSSFMGMSAAAAFWLLRNQPPIQHVLSVAGATTPLTFGLALGAYKCTAGILFYATSACNNRLLIGTIRTALVKTIAIAIATLILSGGGLSLSAFVATGLLVEAFSNLDQRTLIHDIGAELYKKTRDYLGVQP